MVTSKNWLKTYQARFTYLGYVFTIEVVAKDREHAKAEAKRIWDKCFPNYEMELSKPRSSADRAAVFEAESSGVRIPPRLPN